MRTDVKIGITAVLLFSVAALLYFVVSGEHSKQPPPKKDLRIAKTDSNTGLFGSPGTPRRPIFSSPRGEPNQSALPSGHVDSSVTPPGPSGQVSVETVEPAKSGDDVGLSPLVKATGAEPGKFEPTKFEPTRLDLGGSEAVEPARTSLAPEDTRLQPVPIGSSGPILPEARIVEEGRQAAPSGLPAGDLRGKVIRKPDGRNYYIVKDGDKGFWAIAEKAYRDGRKWDIIARANPKANVRLLQPGQEIYIPPLVDVSDASPIALAKSSRSGTPQGRYIVKAGDTFERIAAGQYKDRKLWPAIAKANPTAEPRRLRIGQELILPSLEEARRSLGGGTPATQPAVARRAAPRTIIEPAPTRPEASRGGRAFD
ncbi:MAG TPA: LysM domain-containing protein [Phycisphaerae bacterium]|nr:LysM domain-containing protein [Phycisphaerae bacterium]